MVDRIFDLYEKVKPIAELIEQNKKIIDIIVSDIEDDQSVSDEAWEVISDISSSLLNLSFSGGHTSMNALKDMSVVDTK